jgi:biopolymer transport protein ExbD
MTWQVRHEGSPRSVDGLSLEQVLEGLRDGLWEPTDEVRGPTDAGWVAIEAHPQLAEVAADLEPPPPRTYDDETHLDMNAIIDVCLVLLIFFILTTSYAALQKRLEAPGTTAKKAGLARLTKEQVAQMVHVVIKQEDGKPVIRVEDKVVDPARLVAELRGYARSAGKTSMFLEHDGDVPHEAVVTVLDKARGAGIDKVQLRVP